MPLNKAYRAMWVAAGYSPYMGSAEVLPPPPPDRLRVYHLLPAQFALNNIALRRMKLARFGDLNDPFELLAVNCRRRSFQDALRQHNRTLHESAGLLCFSRDWTSPVLWSHYAERHAGICLGFDVPRGLEESVSYADERLRAQLGDGKVKPLISAELQQQLLFTKFRHWEYEQEVRMLIPLTSALQEGTLYFHRFGGDLKLMEVILGEQCRNDIHEVRAMVRSLHPDAATFGARLAVKSFGIVPDEDRLP